MIWWSANDDVMIAMFSFRLAIYGWRKYVPDVARKVCWSFPGGSRSRVGRPKRLMSRIVKGELVGGRTNRSKRQYEIHKWSEASEPTHIKQTKQTLGKEIGFYDTRALGD